MLMRTVAGNLKPTITISLNGNKWKIVSQSTFKKHVWEFVLGEEIDETTLDGRQVKVIIAHLIFLFKIHCLFN